ncbi:unnamed protein product [Microthlaspi erraticum]|uniref:F-box domain-containing protein n=1 Tax=Microthlaspi erraticum TaxID=1685480 RepID=A0A6D2HCG7_9BRAS|nr:unnamed protein product [Microthlaspi erraticum]
MTRMCDLIEDLVVEILTRVPITSLKAVRSTCKSWDDLSKNFIFGKATSTQQFLGFLTMNSKVYSLRFELQGTGKYRKKGASIKQVAIPYQVEIAKVFHCDGLVLCVPKRKSRLMVWNPYLGQRRWLPQRTDILDNFALGYDNNHNYKILMFSESSYEIYDLSSSSWSVLHVSPDWIIKTDRLCVSLKGRAYFVAEGMIPNVKNFFVGFDFTRERFGQRLPLPFQYASVDTVMLSCARE